MTAVKATRAGYDLTEWGYGVYDRCTQVVGCLPRDFLVGWAKKVTALTAICDHEHLTRLLAGLDEIPSDPDECHALITQTKRTARDDVTHPFYPLVQAYNHLFRGPDRGRDDAARAGTLVHKIAECHVNGEPLPDYTEDIEPYGLAFEKWLADFDPKFLETETTVFSPELEVAGTFDALVEMDNGETLVVDYKTSPKGPYAEWAVQLSFYAHAPLIARPDRTVDRMPVVDGALSLQLTPDGYTFTPLNVSEDVLDVFRALKVVRRWDTELSDTVLGAEVRP